MLAEREEKEKRDNPDACVFVASLCKKQTDEALKLAVQDHFQKWGHVSDVKVLRDWLGRPYAFVQYTKVIHAQTALQEAQGTILNERNIRCEPAKVNRTLCLINYSYPFTKQEIEHSIVASFGELEEVTVPAYDSSNFALVKFRYRSDAIEAFHALRSGRCPPQWHVEWTSNCDQSTEKMTPFLSYDYSSVFVGNLPDNVTNDALADLFGRCGEIKYIRIIRKLQHHRDSKKRVYAFIKFNLPYQAFYAIRRYNDVIWMDKAIRVSLREYRTKPKEKQQQQKTNAFDGCVHYSHYYLPKNVNQQDNTLALSYDLEPFYYQVFYNNEFQYPTYCVFPYYEYRY